MISPPLARCLAKISGDGHISRKYMRYNNTCAVLLEEFVEDMSYLFKDIHFTYGKVNSGTRFVQVQRKAIINYFFSFLPDYRSSVVVVPEGLFDSSRVSKAAYLRALYDDEGCAAFRLFRRTGEWKRNITFSSNSLGLLEGIVLLLSEFNIQTNKIYPNNNSRLDDTSLVLSISGRENFILFQRHIGFLHPKKSSLLSQMINSYKRKVYK